jgi:hypothetical protein
MNSHQNHVERLAYHIDHMDHASAAAFLQKMVDDAEPDAKPFVIKLTEDAAALRRTDVWCRALRTMHEFRWSSY